MADIKVFSDGGARGNPGPAAYGFVVYSDEKEIHMQKEFLGLTTNNVAEYTGLFKAFEWVSENVDNASSIVFHLDSELVVKQMNGEYKIKSTPLFEISQKVKALQKLSSAQVSFVHVRRENNRDADLLVNQALDAHS